MPYIVPLVSAVYIWQGMMNTRTGWVNAALGAIGINGPDWFNDVRWIYPALVIIGLWGVGDMLLFTLAAMQGLPAELYEAARVDGAGRSATFLHITLPMTTPVIFYNLVLSLIGIFQYFIIPFVLTGGTGRAGNAARFYAMQLYKEAFAYRKMGYAAILPRFVTLVPTYTLFYRIGWVGTWLPLIVPHFFANTYNVFLLRQFFMTIPRDLDETAMIDGASPLRTLISIVLPRSIPAVIAAGLGHFIWAWNDYFEPLVYLSAARDLQPIALSIQSYNSLFSTEPHLIQASSLLGLLLPVVLFFIFQRFFMRGIAFTGVEK
jgi:ABC-type glycerol-3-phosphate transport system permease component